MRSLYGPVAPRPAAGAPEDILGAMVGPTMADAVSGMVPEVVGISAQVPPGYGNMGDAAPEDMSSKYVTGRSQRSHVHVAANYTLRPHPNGSHLKYDPAMPLFVLDSEKDPGYSKMHTIYAIWDLNWNIRMATAYKQRKEADKMAPPIYGKRKQLEDKPEYDNFPTTVAELARRIKYIGFGYSAVEQDPDQNPIRFTARRRDMGAQWQGALHHVANIWGPGVISSSQLYFAIKTIPWDGVLTDWQGATLNESSPYTKDGITQILPVHSNTGGVPVGSRSLYTPRDTDNDCLERHTVVCGDDSDPAIDRMLKDKQLTFTFSKYIPAHLIKVGSVARANTRQVSSELAHRATFSFTAYQDLCRNYQQLDIDLSERHAWKACC